MRCSAAPRCIGCGLTRWSGCITTSVRCCVPAVFLLNADHMAFGEALPTFARVSDRALESQWTDAAFAARGIETAEQSWDDLGGEAALATLLAERASRFDGKQRQASPPGFDAHIAALRDAGFREMGTIWQVLADRILLAVR